MTILDIYLHILTQVCLSQFCMSYCGSNNTTVWHTFEYITSKHFLSCCISAPAPILSLFIFMVNVWFKSSQLYFNHTNNHKMELYIKFSSFLSLMIMLYTCCCISGICIFEKKCCDCNRVERSLKSCCMCKLYVIPS